MAWAMIESFRKWSAKRKGLVTGLLGVAIEEVAALVPGAGLAVKIVNEIAKHGVQRLLDEKAEVPDVKQPGQTFATEQLDQINTWLELLTSSYAGLLDKLDSLTAVADNQSIGELTALVQRTLAERADLAQEFAGCAKQVRQMTLSLSRIEEKIDVAYHEIRRVPLALEEIKALLVESPSAAEWAEFRQARPDDVRLVNRANERFLADRRDEGVAVLLGLFNQRGVGHATIARHLGLAYLSQGQLAEARRCLEQSGAEGQPAPALTRALASIAAATGRSERLPVWRSLPRGFVVDQRYQVECEVGRGGMASVYRAAGVIDLVNRGQTVALKVPAPGLMADEPTARRFLQEIAVSQRLSAGNHPGIVQTLGYVIFNDPHTGRKLYGLAMEYIDGLSLAQYLAQRQARQKPLTPAEIVAVLTPICQALDFAHAQDPPVLHRDLKPHNVMLTRRGVAKLMDFGIARVLEESRATLTGQGLVGTPIYMPPEFLDAEADIDARSDVYLAGNLLLEMLTFHRRGSVKKRRPDCPPAWSALINDAMSQDPDKRPPTMQAFLDRLQEGEQVVQEKPPERADGLVREVAGQGGQPVVKTELPNLLTNSIGMEFRKS